MRKLAQQNEPVFQACLSGASRISTRVKQILERQSIWSGGVIPTIYQLAFLAN